MQIYASQIIFGCGIIFLSFIPPLFHYLSSLRRIPKISEDPSSSSFPEVTILVPARDESMLISKKLEEIIGLDYPLSKISILVIDSASEDNTSGIAENFLEGLKGDFSWIVERLESPGKSLAVNKALALIQTDYFVMTDVDSIIAKDSIKIFIEKFSSDSKIGAICGMMATSEETPMEHYRKRFNSLRLWESYIDSTPIFEGSICAFRMSAIQSVKLSANTNADDSQLAIICRRNGFRSIMTNDITFQEGGIQSNSQYRRGLRRAQGLSRTLFHNRDMASFRNPYGRIYLHNLYFYSIMPWISIVGSSLIIFSIFSYINHPLNSPDWTYIISLAMILSSCFHSISRTLIGGVVTLAHAHILAFFGFRLDIWKPSREE